MMRGRRLLGGLLWMIAACGDDGGSATGQTDTDTDSMVTTTSMGTTTLDTTGSLDSTGSGTTGVAADGLTPCDPLDDQCEDGVCSGAARAGFYCRPPCSSMAQEGDPCSGGVCLQASEQPGELACFELTQCDPLDGTGCDLAGGESCVILTFEPLRTACVPSGSTGSGQSCDPAFMHDCDVGLACLGSDLDGDDPGVCTAWCSPGGSLPDGCVQCIEITPEIGSCAECSVVADDCPDGSECQPVNEALGGVCLDHGPAGEGESCDLDTHCQEGFLCLETDVDDVFTCLQKCDRNEPACADPGKACIDLAIVTETADPGQLGVCIETDVVPCDPAAPQCPGEQICLEVAPGSGVCGDACDPSTGDEACEGNYACLPTAGSEVFVPPFVLGNGACGRGCATDVDCGAGNTCLMLDGLQSDGVCGTTCDPSGDDCQAAQTCVATAADPEVGACITDASSCDPTMPDSCVGQANGACIALEGGNAGVCLSVCYEQDPNACAGMPEDCQVRTDPAYHEGFCVGQGQACHPVVQDCPAALSCQVLGGGPLGGTAFVCGEPGAVGEGGDCSADPDVCGLGLDCFAGTCESYCDLQADDCDTGTCTDVSAMFYLPDGSIGACL